jgi:hypothetical protein
VDTATAALSRFANHDTAADREPDGAKQEGDDEVDENVTREYLQTEDPDPSIRAGLDDEIPDLDEGEPPWKFAEPPVKMTAEQRGEALMTRLQELWDAGARDFSSGDLRTLWETTDMSRSWVQKQLKRLTAAGVLGGYDDERQRFLMPDRPELP